MRAERLRWRFDLRGQVQGVGFRPYVYRLATARGLAGFVANDSNGALIEVEGPASDLEAFQRELTTRLPPLARISELKRREVKPRREAGFRIRSSDAATERRPEVTPDAATCADCLRELLDPADRRFHYPFINCTNCGPRYSIIRSVPYDRPFTTMSPFAMCPRCRREYDDPRDRRFHAQPNACGQCGPRLVLRPGPDSARTHGDQDALAACDSQPVATAARMLTQGRIIAVKGIGGYHLACRADRNDVVVRLRELKLRDGKPLAVMVADVDAARRLCHLAAADEDALRSPAAPIVLAPKRDARGLADSVAPGSRDFGLMLPYSPLHHLLFAEGVGPLVMTSANLAGQPLTFRDEDALAELGDVADAFLMHDREIFRPIDDSVVFTFRDEPVPMRRARGYAPRPIRVVLGAGDNARHGRAAPARATRILAVGGELKSTVCLLADQEAVISEHLGDLSNADAYRHYVEAVGRLKELCAFEPEVVVCDMHPRYLASAYARGLGLPLVEVQHHHAHIASVMAEWGEPGPVVGLSCDGLGYGTDGAVWGCEVLLCERGECRRLGQHAYYPQVGGDAAALETWRPAAALLREVVGERWREWLGPGPGEAALHVFDRQAARSINTVPTSSLGRVFDAASFLLGLCERNRHEAEGAMALEAAAGDEPDSPEPLAYDVGFEGDSIRLSLARTVAEVAAARRAGSPVSVIAARFHAAVARMLAGAARLACERQNVGTVGLSGGCFANRRLLQHLVSLLEGAGVRVLYHRRVPCGDGGLSLGQAIVAAWRLRDGTVGAGV